MLSKKLEKISLEYYQKYQEEGISVDLKQLSNTARAAANKAEDNYSKLLSPKTCPKEVYLAHWAREVLDRDFVLRTLIPINHKNPPSEPHLQAMVDYFSLLPLELIHGVNQKINNTSPADRKKLWESSNFPIKEANDKFTKLILARRNYFLEKRRLSLPGTFLKQFKIPKSAYQEFIQNKNEVINFCNEFLPDVGKLPSWFYSELNLPCYLCRLSEFPFGNFKEVIDFVFQKYSSFSAFKPKVKIKMGEETHVKYEKKTDSFLITIDRYANFRHQATGLIHELGHVISFLKDFQNRLDPLEKGKYYEEKNAIKIQFSVLKNLSENLFRASLAEVLLTFWKIMFETSLYENPNQDIEKLYANTFNICFKGSNQKKNPFYLLNEAIITSPFSSLPHAVAYYKILQGMKMNEKKSSLQTQKINEFFKKD